MIWGMTLEPGKLYTEVIGDEVHLSMASLESRKDFAPEGEKPEGTCHIIMKTEKSEYLLCTLANGVIYQQSLDLKLMPREKVTFSVQGSNMVYLTGYSTSYPDMDDHYEGESETGEWEPYDTGGNMTLNSEELNEMSALEDQEGEEQPPTGEISIKTEAVDPLDQPQNNDSPSQQADQQQLPMDTPEPPILSKQEPTDGSEQQEMIFSIAQLEANVKQEPQEMPDVDDITIIPEDDEDEQPLQQQLGSGDHHAQQQQLHEQQQLQELQSQLQQHSNQLQQQQQSHQYMQQQQQPAAVMRAAPLRTRGYPPARQRTRGRPMGSSGRGRGRQQQQTFQQNQPSGSSYSQLMAAQGSPRMSGAGYQGAPAMQQNVAQAPMQQDQAMLSQPGSSRQAGPGPSTSNTPDQLAALEGLGIDSLQSTSCFICAKTFGDRSRLKRHLLCHSRIRPFTCETCGRSFHRKDHFNTHVLGHTRRFHCGRCGKGYSRKDVMRKHEKSCQ